MGKKKLLIFSCIKRALCVSQIHGFRVNTGGRFSFILKSWVYLSSMVEGYLLMFILSSSHIMGRVYFTAPLIIGWSCDLFWPMEQEWMYHMAILIKSFKYVHAVWLGLLSSCPLPWEQHVPENDCFFSLGRENKNAGRTNLAKPSQPSKAITDLQTCKQKTEWCCNPPISRVISYTIKVDRHATLNLNYFIQQISLECLLYVKFSAV